MTTMVQFDKTYLDGNLAGLVIPGETVTYPDDKSAQHHAAFLEKVMRSGDFVRDCGTGKRYSVSNVQLFDGAL